MTRTSGKRNLKRDFEYQWGQIKKIDGLTNKWYDLLTRPITGEQLDILESVSELLAHLGLDPSSITLSPGQPYETMDPRVFLYNECRDHTRKEKADILFAALKVWAGAWSLELIERDYPNIDHGDVIEMLIMCDFETYTNRRGYHVTKEEIRDRWDISEWTEDKIDELFRNYLGGT